ncbi:MAG TPA: inositol monophosphatase [Chromatiaceae bacterium]|nr:inositol monophosphatase [Chromatiaceae bacterium]
MIHRTPFAENAEWSDLKELIRSLAKAELMNRFHKVEASLKGDGSLITEADRAMQFSVKKELQRRWPEYAFLGEESTCDHQRQALRGEGGCWILDPLDGTTNYAHGFELFSSSLALSVAGKSVLGIVHDPVRDETFAARRGLGAELNGRSLSLDKVPQTLGTSLALVDFKRLSRPLAIALVTEPPFASQRNIGSVALEWCWLAAGRADLYLHGGQRLWDYAAGQLIFSEAGGASCTFEGDSIPSHSTEPRSALAAGNSVLLGLWKEALNPYQ